MGDVIALLRAAKAASRCLLWRGVHSVAVTVDRRFNRFGDARAMPLAVRFWAMSRWEAATNDLNRIVEADDD